MTGSSLYECLRSVGTGETQEKQYCQKAARTWYSKSLKPDTLWAFTPVIIQRHTWTVPTPLQWSPGERTATRYHLFSTAEANHSQLAQAPSVQARCREAVKTNFSLLPLAFAGRSPRACSGYLLTRFRPQEPPSTVS